MRRGIEGDAPDAQRPVKSNAALTHRVIHPNPPSQAKEGASQFLRAYSRTNNRSA